MKDETDERKSGIVKGGTEIVVREVELQVFGSNAD